MQTILIDTREQKYSHIEKYFCDNGIKYVRSKLYVGDYQCIGDGTLVIDRKYGLQEVYGNVINDHERLRNELQRAFDAGVHIIFLVEHSGIQDIQDVHKWKNPRVLRYYAEKKRNPTSKKKPPASSSALQKAMQTMAEKYGVEWRFCAKEDTARTIVEILTGGE